MMLDCPEIDHQAIHLSPAHIAIQDKEADREEDSAPFPALPNEGTTPVVAKSSVFVGSSDSDDDSPARKKKKSKKKKTKKSKKAGKKEKKKKKKKKKE